MAAYNSSSYIAASIQSILDQSFLDFELLIINDGSTDNTETVVKKFDDPRIRLLFNEGNKGLTYTRNRGLQEARGKYFAVLDSDDIATPDRLQRQYNFMEAHPNIVLCGGQAILINENDDEIGLYTVPANLNLREQMVFRNVFINPACMMLTDVVRTVGGYRDFAPAEDFDLFVRLSNKYLTANLNSTLVKYRVHPNNASGKNSIVRMQERRIFQSMHCQIGLKTSEKLIEIHQAIFLGAVDTYNIKDIRCLLRGLKIANNDNRFFDRQFFNRYLFEKWVFFLRQRKVKMNALSLYFDKVLFEWCFLTFKDFRKMLKFSLKGIGRISK